MRIDDFLQVRWSEPGYPLIEPPRLSPIIADPSFLFPNETPDGTWALFAHSAWGIHRYDSQDGLAWCDRGISICNAMRPFIRRQGRVYTLYYEKYSTLALPMTALPLRPRWRSTIAMSTGSDLVRWSRPRTLITPSESWMRDPKLGESVSNPCLVQTGAGVEAPWRLYFSASLVWIDDCGFCEPHYIAAADGYSPHGPFEPRQHPILDPVVDGEPGALGSGSIKVLRLDDGWLGLQNKLYRDPAGQSRSAIFVLRSDDGLHWREATPHPLLAPGKGWMSSHVYACDCRFHESDGSWYLYFNARDGWSVGDGKERIGRMVGRA